MDFNLALIPESFAAAHAEEFDTAYMRQLYELARTMAAGGYPWEKEPPDHRARTGPAVTGTYAATERS